MPTHAKTQIARVCKIAKIAKASQTSMMKPFAKTMNG